MEKTKRNNTHRIQTTNNNQRPKQNKIQTQKTKNKISKKLEKIFRSKTKPLERLHKTNT